MEDGIYVTLPIETKQGCFSLASFIPEVGDSVKSNLACVYSAFHNSNEIYIRTDVYYGSDVGKPASVYWVTGGK